MYDAWGYTTCDYCGIAFVMGGDHQEKCKPVDPKRLEPFWAGLRAHLNRPTT